MGITKNVKALDEIMVTLRLNRAELAKHYHVKDIGVFGSYARSKQRVSSDVDILVDFSEPVGLFRFLELEEHLHELLGIKVDLVTKGALKPRIGERILKEVVYL